MARKIIKGVGKLANVATFGLAGSAVKEIFGKKKKAAPATPAAEEPAVMPLADDEKVRAARKRSMIRQRARSGRDSTILSGDRLGG